MNDKNQLLDELEPIINKDKSLDFKYLLFMLLIMSFVSMILFPKIYIEQRIYYKSRNIAKLKGEYDTLLEENKLIQSSVESMKFKNQILDTLF